MTELLPLLISVVLMGISGAPHCLGMCGGLSIALNANADAKPSLISRLLRQNLGRIAGYSLMGLIAGTIGYGVGTIQWAGAAQIAVWMTALLMLLVALQLFGLNRPIAWFERLMVRLVGPAQQFATGRAWFGALGWGLMPCGLSYSALAFAGATASPVDGVLVMAAFGLSTLPSIMFATLLGQQLIALGRSKVLRAFSGILLLAYAAFILVNFYTQTGH